MKTFIFKIYFALFMFAAAGCAQVNGFLQSNPDEGYVAFQLGFVKIIEREPDIKTAAQSLLKYANAFEAALQGGDITGSLSNLMTQVRQKVMSKKYDPDEMIAIAYMLRKMDGAVDVVKLDGGISPESQVSLRTAIQAARDTAALYLRE